MATNPITLDVVSSGKINSHLMHVGTLPVDLRVAFRDYVEEILMQIWRGLRDGCAEKDRMWAFGHIEAFHALKILNDQEYKRWIFSMDHCPGHNDEGGRTWCAYCGNLPQPKEEETKIS